MKRMGLLRLAGWFAYKSGIITACQLIEGDLTRESVDVRSIQRQMNTDISKSGVNAFGEAYVTKNFERGAILVAQANGMAGIKSNTVLLGWSGQREHRAGQLRIMRAPSRSGISTLIVKLNWKHEPGKAKRIDLWWGGKRRNGDLMLLLAYQLKSNTSWRDSKITIRSAVRSTREKEIMEKKYTQIIPRTRINVDVEVFMLQENETFTQLLHQQSANSDITFLGMKIPDMDEEIEYADVMDQLSSGLKTTIFVLNGEPGIPVLLDLERI